MRQWLLGLLVMVIGFGLIGTIPAVKGQESLGPVVTFSPSNFWIRGVKFSHDNRRLLTWEIPDGTEASKYFGEVYVRNIETGQIELQFSEPDVVDATWNQDETMLLSMGALPKTTTDALNIRDMQGNLLFHAVEPVDYAWSPDGHWLVLTRNVSEDTFSQMDYVTELWNIFTGEMLASWDAGFWPIVVGDIFVFTQDGKIFFYSVSHQTIEAEYPFEERFYFSSSVFGSPDGSEIYVKQSRQLFKYTISTHDFKAVEPNPFVDTLSMNDDMSIYLRLDPDSGRIYAYEFATGRLLSELPIQDRLEFGWVSNDTLYTQNPDGYIHVWDVNSGEEIRSFTYGVGIRQAWPAKNQPFMVTSTILDEIGLWNVDTGVGSWIDLDSISPYHKANVRNVFWSEDGQSLAVISDLIITVWDAAAVLASNQVFPAMTRYTEQLFFHERCSFCHADLQDRPDATGPSLKGIYGQERVAADGTTFVVDDAYLTATLMGNEYSVPGYEPYHVPLEPGRPPANLPGEIEVLIAYIKHLTN